MNNRKVKYSMIFNFNKTKFKYEDEKLACVNLEAAIGTITLECIPNLTRSPHSIKLKKAEKKVRETPWNM